MPFSDEQLRTLINLRQRYDVWMEAERQLAQLPYDLRRKIVDGKTYLYEIFDHRGNGKSLGRMNDALEAQFNTYRDAKLAAQAQRDGSLPVVTESARLYRALRLPMLSSGAGAILQECDRRTLLGDHLLVVGTNALAAYAIEAAGFLTGAPDETEDFDLAWSATEGHEGEALVWSMLKAVDPTFTVNTERTFQARNAKAYEVEILVAPSRVGTMGRNDRPKPVPLPEQEWLLLGRPVDQVAVCRDGTPVRIVAPDPRWFALQKLWMSDKATRDPLKRPKDRKQGVALLRAVAEAMPQYPMDAGFEAGVPDELRPYYEGWCSGRLT
ncbi:nucleotidyltransferase domain-containing protein [Hyphomonas sp. WL0036]|uniref:GSU2403 family nucleotidyltransferase fold protein n=1 Tax=Hyphomonas sediminis TaxID=2866160 RepID=UPI001C7F66AD|nr:GSU2403 family nucleotidyltransferase fold protein [Hyphomonas sediminis]MBY9067106.1 nucleotidyltransferase domain-containing protein [Hyphomonas sediminis]